MASKMVRGGGGGGGQGEEDELRPDAEANRIIADKDLIDIDIKELNKMLKERGVAKELAVRLKQRRRTLKNRNYASR